MTEAVDGSASGDCTPISRFSSLLLGAFPSDFMDTQQVRERHMLNLQQTYRPSAIAYSLLFNRPAHVLLSAR